MESKWKQNLAQKNVGKYTYRNINKGGKRSKQNCKDEYVQETNLLVERGSEKVD